MSQINQKLECDRSGFTKKIVLFLCLLSAYGCTLKGYCVDLNATRVEHSATFASLLLGNGFILIEQLPVSLNTMRGHVERYSKPVFEAESFSTRSVDHSLHVNVFYPQNSDEISISIYSFNHGKTEASRSLLLQEAEEIEQILRKSFPSAEIIKTQHPIGEPFI